MYAQQLQLYILLKKVNNRTFNQEFINPIKMHESIEKITGPLAILAGAGTGKTYIIVEKVKYLLQKKIYAPERIVCLTFSNEAVNTLRKRIIPNVIDGHEPIIRTFHSYCADLLKKHGHKIGIEEKFKIITPDDSKIMLHKYFKILPSLCTKYSEEIHKKKDGGLSVQEEEKKEDLRPLESIEKSLKELNNKLNTAHLKKDKEEIKKIKAVQEPLEKTRATKKFIAAWKAYEKIKEKKKGLDYADLHTKAFELLSKYPSVAEECDYLIIDEFQDTNKVQCELIDKIALKRNVMIVGDLNQSIYRFRGAYTYNFEFIKTQFHIQEKDIMKLAKSHRSTNKILSIAHTLIAHNYIRKEDCFEVTSAKNETGENPEVYELLNGKEEVRKSIELIRKEIQKNTPLEQICVIFRTHQQAALLRQQLEREDIPYTIVNRDSLLKTKIIKKIRAYLSLIVKYQSASAGGDSAWWELIHESGLKKEEEIACAYELKKIREEPYLTKKIVEEGIPNIPETAFIKLQQIVNIIKTAPKDKKEKLTETITSLYGLLGLTKEEETSKEQIMELEKFRSIAEEFANSEYEDLSSFVHHLETIDALSIAVEIPRLAKEGIRIMTNHATKGLEYEVVIMSSLAQKKFPLERTLSESVQTAENQEEQAIAEERRLCYVGFTRAKKRLYITYAKEYNKRTFEPSQFLHEINYKENTQITFFMDHKQSEEKQNVPEIKNAESTPIKKLNFSPSSLQLFDECQKKYEYRYIYGMPEKTPESWSAITLGKFVHEVLERGVKNNLKTEKEFEDCAKTVQMEEYPDQNVEEVMPFIKTFIIRNKSRYNERSQVEVPMQLWLDGMNFVGFADRIDTDEEGNITIVDYKTGKSEIKPKYRNWQLGLYALAAKKIGQPKSLILDLLQKDHALEFVIDRNGVAKEIHSARTSFSLEEVKQELIDTAKKIIDCQKNGFSPCPLEKSCEFCEEWVRKK
jgi:superfamily I DNA/RNA helicase/RecB family exonuclease